MNDENPHQPQPMPLELKSQQRTVLELLKEKQTEKYPLSEWYLGALHALSNSYNPDRVSQAAHSLRELIEKFLRINGQLDVNDSHNLIEMRRKLDEKFSDDKERYKEDWHGKEINEHLADTLREFGDYLELDQRPTRKEAAHTAIRQLDPMDGQVASRSQQSKGDKLHKLRKKLESIAHHKDLNIEELMKFLGTLERMLFDLLAPVTAQDQNEIQSILERLHRLEDDEERMFSLIERKGANYEFFLKKVTDPTWLPVLKKKGYLDQRLSAQMMRYLEKVSKIDPSLVVDTILASKDTNNSQFLSMVVDIAPKIKPIEQSLRLKGMVLKSLRFPHRLHASDRIADIMNYWVGASAEAINPALEIMKATIAFKRDDELRDKQGHRQENPSNLAALSLNPESQVSLWIYDRILEEGTRLLSEIEPCETARILIEATAKMIRLEFHSDMPENAGNDDGSTVWCPRLNAANGERTDTRKNLVHALTLACKKVYEKTPESVPTLNIELQKQRWFIFTRIQQHLYAIYPNEQTKPWIREMILNYGSYRKWEYHFELERMIRCACENIGDNLLDKEEKERIFEDILSGPLEEELPEERKRRFHSMQLRPFASVLFGKYADYFQELEAGKKRPIVDDDYMPVRHSGVKYMENISPKPLAALGEMPDDELLSYLNEWDDVREDPDQWWVNINFSGLAEAFQSLFMDTILPDKAKLGFWMDNLDRIQRPVYVCAMVSAMHEYAKRGEFDMLDRCFDLCEWVLFRPNQPTEEGIGRNEKSKEHPSWESSRRAVGDFVGMCMQEDVNAPILSRYRLASLLDKLCTRYERRLDDDEPVLPARDDLYTEAINNTRGRALGNLVDFGYWVRRQLGDVQADAHEIFSILDKRLDLGCEHPLTLPERAILGSHYHHLFSMNQEWATRRKNDIFLQKDPQEWAAAFGNYLNHNQPHKLIFDIVRDDIKLALDDMERFNIKGFGRDDPVDSLGRHLFSYYLWTVYPLTGEDSLLERFYGKTNEDRWARLFGNTGRGLQFIDKQPDDALQRKIIQFAEWRLNKKSLSERKEFLSSWIQAECLDEKWRLNSLSNILDIHGLDNPNVYTSMSALQRMVGNHTELAMDCFLKLIEITIKNKGDDHSLAHKAKPILRVGLTSDSAATQAKAKRAQEYLLRLGHSNLLDDAEE